MIGDGIKIVEPSLWVENVVGKSMVVEANQNTGMMTWTEKQSGTVLMSVENKDICTGSWRFFVSLCARGTRIELVPTQAED